ncbi:hypothetical protein F4777DRAFT_528995 [Nemania sp. FL0916]|nr:hypothetical protein F4777DRAFT_528995 [Nemania sp. FL0916]
MVVKTPPLSAFKKRFLPQIHHPLPLDRRQSQQLYENITKSFRKYLDLEHPWQGQAEEEPAKTPVVATSDSARPVSRSRHRPTEQHLRAVLSNPLFAHPRDAHDARDNGVAAPLRTPQNKPFDIFDSAVSKGLMTPHRAAGFLATIRSQLLAESPHKLYQRMGASGAGYRVLQWIRASGQEHDLSFLSCQALIKVIVPFLYAEGLQEVLWTWLAQLGLRGSGLKLESTPGKAREGAMYILMSSVIRELGKSDSPSPLSLDGSFAALAKADDILPRENLVAATAMKGVWANLSWESTVDALQRPKPSATLFENFVDIGRPFNLSLDLAHLDLHHPTTPTHSAAIEYLHLRREILEDLSKMQPQYQQRILWLVSDAADRLKQTGQLAEEPWLERLRATIYQTLNLDFGIEKENSQSSVTPVPQA